MFETYNVGFGSVFRSEHHSCLFQTFFIWKPLPQSEWRLCPVATRYERRLHNLDVCTERRTSFGAPPVCMCARAHVPAGSCLCLFLSIAAVTQMGPCMWCLSLFLDVYNCVSIAVHFCCDHSIRCCNSHANPGPVVSSTLNSLLLLPRCCFLT